MTMDEPLVAGINCKSSSGDSNEAPACPPPPSSPREGITPFNGYVMRMRHIRIAEEAFHRIEKYRQPRTYSSLSRPTGPYSCSNWPSRREEIRKAEGQADLLRGGLPRTVKGPAMTGVPRLRPSQREQEAPMDVNDWRSQPHKGGASYEPSSSTLCVNSITESDDLESEEIADGQENAYARTTTRR
ncbi:hypothetical protein FOZ62_017069 [Perkinsus olseni]|uniref:Uncharacterized protein n=1 Tax=Perkinsus olseni TaxID=32597 RepID=A0A7J6TS74_PEROL|nr:hypothetical protein FOZ62_017069 [Perkinsus olseni]